MRRIALIALMICFVPFLAAAPANAQATRTWVSGVGDDANPCSRTAPCKTFAGAISKTAAGGEINCLDSAGYGALTITKAISVICEGVIGGVLVSGTNGFIVNAGVNDVVVVKGLDFQGLGTGLNGFNFLAGKALYIDRCSINNFSTNGILMAPSANVSTLVVTNTTVTNSGGATGSGIKVAPTGTGFVRAFARNVSLDRNFFGASSSTSGQTASLDIVDSSITFSTSNGLTATGAGASVRVGGSFIVGNQSAATSGSVTSWGNNIISNNATDNTPPSAGTLK